MKIKADIQEMEEIQEANQEKYGFPIRGPIILQYFKLLKEADNLESISDIDILLHNVITFKRT